MEIIKTDTTKEIRKELEQQEWYSSLTEDCDAIITETVFNSRWELIKGYHELGKRILLDLPKFEEYKAEGESAVQCIAKSTGKSQRTIYYAIKFARKYDDINQLPEGKNISWYKVCNQVLTENTDTTEEKESDENVCKSCGRPLE